MTTRPQIDEFLSHKRLAVIGVSRNAKDFSRLLFREFRARGYEAVPVNPAAVAQVSGAAQIDGVPCFSSIGAINPGVDAALLLTSPDVTADVVRDCETAGIRHVWLYRSHGAGAVSPAAVEFCESHGISVVAGECPFMFFPNPTGIHRFHGWLRRLFGKLG